LSVIVETPDYIIRSCASLGEGRDFWWPHMQDLGWNRNSLDAQTHYKVARDGKDWFLLISKETSRPEGMIIAFTYPNSTGWVGFFIVNRESRGKGWGAALFRALLASCEQTKTTFIGLDGVEEQMETYRRRGFVQVGRIKLMTRPSLRRSPLNKTTGYQLEGGLKIIDLKNVDASKLANFDLAHTGFYRPALWTRDGLFSRADVIGFAVVSAWDPEELKGIILVRCCDHGFRFGPLLA
ncbi:acyl-CoA N-acyltransferase, partial [Coniochaeta sp. 2T2.1]